MLEYVNIRESSIISWLKYASLTHPKKINKKKIASQKQAQSYMSFSFDYIAAHRTLPSAAARTQFLAGQVPTSMAFPNIHPFLQRFINFGGCHKFLMWHKNVLIMRL